MKRIGIYAGSFDPIHEGHVAFALAALKSCGLDKIFFLPEPRPRYKQSVKALKHRTEMVQLAIHSNNQLGLIELNQARFTVQDTLPVLQARFKGAELYFLLGDDVLKRILHWPNVAKLTNQVKFIIGGRQSNEREVGRLAQLMDVTGGPKFQYTFVKTNYTNISSANIRASLKRNRIPQGLNDVVLTYINKNKLYRSEPSE